VSPAVVQIEVLGYIYSDDDKSDDKDRIDTHIVTKTNVMASGVIMGTDGYIITSAHTVNGAKRVRVNLDDRVCSPQWNSVPPVLTFDARVVGKCQQADLALLKIDAYGLPTVSLVDSNTVRPGTLVVAVGNPEKLKNLVSMGIVSAVARSRQCRSARALLPDRCSH
jgi:serine protease Do